VIKKTGKGLCFLFLMLWCSIAWHNTKNKIYQYQLHK
jgi:hypothetical protein